MDQTSAPQTSSGKNRSNAALLLLVLLLVLSNAVLLYLYMKEQDKVETNVAVIDRTVQEKENVSAMLKDVLDSYDTLRTAHEQTQAEMAAQRERIEELLDKVKRGDYDIAKAKKEAATLRRIMQGYVVTIDSLNRLNQELRAENVNITQELGEVRGQKEALTSKTQELEGQIAKGSVLHATSIVAEAIEVRNNGTQKPVDRAKKAEMVRCCFTVGENRVTRPGDKTFHMRVISPDGRVLPTGDGVGRFTFNGVEGEYSAKREVNYQNKPVEVCIYWNGGVALSTGQYIVEIYEAGALVEKTGFTLK